MAKDTEHTAHHAGTAVNGSQAASDSAHATHSDGQEPSGGGHRTQNTAHRRCMPLNGSQVVKDSAHAT